MYGVVSELTNELKELRETVSKSVMADDVQEPEFSTAPQNAESLRGGAYVSCEGVATADSGPVGSRVQRSTISRFSQKESKGDHSEPQINSFHHFHDVHLAGDKASGPPDSHELGRELLSMLRMARLKVRQERRHTDYRSGGHSDMSRAVGEPVTTQNEDGVRSSQRQIQSSMLYTFNL